MKNKKILIISLFLLLALSGALILVNQNQETRRSAYFSTASITVLPTELSKEVGQDVPVQIWVNTPEGDKVDGVRAVLCYGDGTKIGGFEGATVQDREDSAMEAVTTYKSDTGMDIDVVLLREYDGKKCINLTFTSNLGPNRLKSGSFKVGTVNFKALAPGNVTVETLPVREEVSGNNPNDPIDKAMEVSTDVSQSMVTITGSGGDTPTAIPTDLPPANAEDTLSFKMTFLGALKQYNGADGWRLSVIVRDEDGNQQVFENIATTRLDEVSTVGGAQLATYRVSLPLSTLATRQNLAVFIRGPKHIQVKYGADGQSGLYNKEGGELAVVANRVFDFTKYPLLPGDITGTTRGVQDGVVDGLDWVFLLEEIARGRQADIKADLDANGKVNGADLTVLSQALVERQSQLY